jgi:hypothetical protein
MVTTALYPSGWNPASGYPAAFIAVRPSLQDGCLEHYFERLATMAALSPCGSAHHRPFRRSRVYAIVEIRRKQAPYSSF